MSASRKHRRVRPAIEPLPDFSLPPPSSPLIQRAASPSPLAAARHGLQGLDLDSHEMARVEDFLFKKSVFLQVDELRHEDFEQILELGRGNSGAVFKVVHKPTNILLARKLIYLEIKPSLRERILRELKVLHGCSSPYIIGFYGSFWHDGEINILMEYMDGGSLDSVLKRIGRIPEQVLAEITHSVLQGLIYLRDKLRIIHRDIKPSNILVNTDGACKLCDFGVSGELNNTLANTFVGTRSYMSPERLQGEKYSVESDVWSLGMSLVEMATGLFPIPVERLEEEIVELRPPPEVMHHEPPSQPMAIFELLSHIVQGDPPRIPVKFGFTEKFADFVDCCLKKDPADRTSLQDLLTHAWLVGTRASSPVNMQDWVRSTMVPSELQERDHEKESHTPAP